MTIYLAGISILFTIYLAYLIIKKPDLESTGGALLKALLIILLWPVWVLLVPISIVLAIIVLVTYLKGISSELE